jgi:hypothetical protein
MAYEHLNGKERRFAEKAIEAENRKYGEKFIELPFKQNTAPNRIKVFRNRRYLVQVFQENKAIRLSVNRTSIDRKGAWLDGITWDELFQIKNAVGYADFDAVEIFPAERDVVNVANIRHLWV